MAQLTAFSMKAGFDSEADSWAMNQLLNYCQYMNIQMQTVQYGTHVVMNFIGREDNLSELNQHLKKVQADHAG